VLQADGHRRLAVVARDVDDPLAPGGEVRHGADVAADVRRLGLPEPEQLAVVASAEQGGTTPAVGHLDDRPRDVGGLRLGYFELDPLALTAADKRA
jgi:hypothetical protein